MLIYFVRLLLLTRRNTDRLALCRRGQLSVHCGTHRSRLPVQPEPRREERARAARPPARAEPGAAPGARRDRRHRTLLLRLARPLGARSPLPLRRDRRGALSCAFVASASVKPLRVER